MKNRQQYEAVFRRIAEGFNLTEGEVDKTLKQPLKGLKKALNECFRQIQNPEQHLSPEDYEFLTKEVGCVNLETMLKNEPLSEEQTTEHKIMCALLTEMPLRFTYSMLMSAVQLVAPGSEDTVIQILELLSHKNVGILKKEGDYYAFDPNATIK